MAGQKKILRLLKLLQGEKDPEKRQEIIELSRKTLLKWFLIGAKNLLKGTIPIDKQTQRFIDKHREDLSVIADKHVNDDNRLKAILKRGGAGFLGGVIIRHLLKWNLSKERIAKPRKSKAKSKSKKKITQKLNIKDFVKTAPLRKDLPDWIQKQVDLHRQGQTGQAPPQPPNMDKITRTPGGKMQLMVRLPYQNPTPGSPASLVTPNVSYQDEDLDATLPYMDDKAVQIMDRAMTGPIGAARTSDNILTSTPTRSSPAPSLFDHILPFSPLTGPVSPEVAAASTPKRRPSLKLKKKAKDPFAGLKKPWEKVYDPHPVNQGLKGLKYFCPHDGVGFRLKENYDRHMATAHLPSISTFFNR